MKAKYKRVVLKVSGEALAGEAKLGLDNEIINEICKEIKNLKDLGVEVAIVVGGGNFFRGRTSEGMERATADYIGMLATVMNGLALRSAFENLDVDVRLQSAIDMNKVCETYIRQRAIRHLEKGRIVIFAGGTGYPFFTTDTTASLRAAEIGADVILSAKSIDGVYDKDPKIEKDAKMFKEIAFYDILEKGLKVIDLTAASLCDENNIDIRLFSINPPSNIVKAGLGEDIGTIIKK